MAETPCLEALAINSEVFPVWVESSSEAQKGGWGANVMECYCEPAILDGNADVWHVTWHTARKAHKCCECHEPIATGQRYERIFLVYDGSFDTFKTCEFCAKEYKRLLNKYPDISWMKGRDDLACLVVWDIRNEVGHD